eukprot:4830413-Pleurochrysis_carterae.AAC.1
MVLGGLSWRRWFWEGCRDGDGSGRAVGGLWWRGWFWACGHTWGCSDRLSKRRREFWPGRQRSVKASAHA